jgi:hypothetical protein
MVVKQNTTTGPNQLYHQAPKHALAGSNLLAHDVVERTMMTIPSYKGVVNRESSDCQVLLNGEHKPLVLCKQLRRKEKQ